MKKFKKVYLEITNVCNLKCDFCIQNERESKFISKENFTYILNELKDYTDYLYFHLLGEPLMHLDINEYIDLASKDFKINITTNGYLINKIKFNNNIRQINISLHSYDQSINLDDYLNSIFDVANELNKNNTIINYRIWIDCKFKNQIIDKLNKHYNVLIDDEFNFKIKDNVFINFDQQFIWPDLNNELNEEYGTCIGLKEHLGILVDGTVVPCCLDTKGNINLGNILNESLMDILNKKRTKEIVTGFENNQKCESLCRKCQFYNSRKKNI